MSFNCLTAVLEWMMVDDSWEAGMVNVYSLHFCNRNGILSGPPGRLDKIHYATVLSSPLPLSRPPCHGNGRAAWQARQNSLRDSSLLLYLSRPSQPVMWMGGPPGRLDKIPYATVLFSSTSLQPPPPFQWTRSPLLWLSSDLLLVPLPPLLSLNEAIFPPNWQKI